MEGAGQLTWLDESVEPGMQNWQPHVNVVDWGAGKLGALQVWPWWKLKNPCHVCDGGCYCFKKNKKIHVVEA